MSILTFTYIFTVVKNEPYPPGPHPKPLIGNMMDFPTKNPAQEYSKWRKRYNSDIVFASALGNHLLILNNPEDAVELLQKRASKYSDRPPVPIMKLLGWDPAMVSMLRYGEQWRLHRRIMQQNFNYESSKRYRPTIKKKVYEMLNSLLESPEDFALHNKILGISIPLALMYGYDIKSIDDPIVLAAEKSVRLGAPLLAPGGSMINIFPFLAKIPSWFPGASSHKVAFEVKRLTELMQTIPFEYVKDRLSKGTAVSSLVSDFLERKNTVGTSKVEETAVKNIAYTIYGAAGDTTISATGTFIYQMCINPEIQMKAQEELDRAIGGRLPTFDDRESLPYVEAIYREVLRWNPPLLLGIPHYSIDDDHYKGYFIPKNTTVIGNLWGMAHNEDIYLDPYVFNPERFFDSKGDLQEDPTSVYGFGRRICAGKYIASASVWLTMASILTCFNIRRVKDELGNEVNINDHYEDFTTISYKAPYQCSIIPRFQQVGEMIAHELSEN